MIHYYLQLRGKIPRIFQPNLSIFSGNVPFLIATSQLVTITIQKSFYLFADTGIPKGSFILPITWEQIRTIPYSKALLRIYCQSLHETDAKNYYSLTGTYQGIMYIIYENHQL